MIEYPPGVIMARKLTKDLYAAVFTGNWPVWLGGLLIGLISVATFYWARPWGIVAGPREWADWSLYSVGIYGSHPDLNPLMSWSSILVLGLILGAFSSSLMSRQFAVKVPPPFEFLRSAVGGILMGAGAALAGGCNLGGFFSATSALSLSGPLMMAGLLLGAFLEVRYYYWELEHFRFKRGEGRPRRPKPGAPDLKRFHPWLGALVFLAVLAVAFAYIFRGLDPASGYDYGRAGGLLVLALAMGLVFHRSRFAFLQSFREPFISGNGAQARGMAIAVIVSVLGFAVLKAGGLRPEGDYVLPTFWAGSFFGGLIFGFGMPFGGGCASGACWRTGEGSIKLVTALAVMAFSNSLFTKAIGSSETLRSAMGGQVFLPDYISYHWSVILIVVIMIAYYLVMSWNEKTRKFI